MFTWIKRDIWLYIGFLSIDFMYIIYLNGSTTVHMVKYLAWKRTKMTKQNKITTFWKLQM